MKRIVNTPEKKIDRTRIYKNNSEVTFKPFDHVWFSGWDVSSGCIWDLSIIESYTLITKLNT